MSIKRPTLKYGCEAWTTTRVKERRLRTLKNKVLRKICDPVFDMNMGSWRRRYNRELQDSNGNYLHQRSKNSIARSILRRK